MDEVMQRVHGKQTEQLAGTLLDHELVLRVVRRQ